MTSGDVNMFPEFEYCIIIGRVSIKIADCEFCAHAQLFAALFPRPCPYISS